MMLFLRSFVATASFIGFAAAQTPKIAFTSVPAVVVAGQSYNITWGGGDGTSVTLILREGNAKNLNTIGTVGANINEDYYMWQVSSDLSTAGDYALQIIQGLTGINYSGEFSLEGGTDPSRNAYTGTDSSNIAYTGSSSSSIAYTSSSSTTHSVTTTTSGSSTITGVSATSMGTGTVILRNTTFSSMALTSSARTTTAASITAHTTSSSTSTSATSSQSTSAPTSNAGTSKLGSSGALVVGLLGAIMFLR